MVYLPPSWGVQWLLGQSHLQCDSPHLWRSDSQKTTATMTACLCTSPALKTHLSGAAYGCSSVCQHVGLTGTTHWSATPWAMVIGSEMFRNRGAGPQPSLGAQSRLIKGRGVCKHTSGNWFPGKLKTQHKHLPGASTPDTSGSPIPHPLWHSCCTMPLATLSLYRGKQGNRC